MDIYDIRGWNKLKLLWERKNLRIQAIRNWKERKKDKKLNLLTSQFNSPIHPLPKKWMEDNWVRPKFEKEYNYNLNILLLAWKLTTMIVNRVNIVIIVTLL